MAARRRTTRSKRTTFAIRRWRESKAVRRARAAEIVRRLRELYPEAAAELNFRNPLQSATRLPPRKRETEPMACSLP